MAGYSDILEYLFVKYSFFYCFFFCILNLVFIFDEQNDSKIKG
jgi:hypothetical protein